MVLNVQKPSDPQGVTLEAWSEGYMVGSLIVMACVTLANMRRGVLLHKLILIELIFGMFMGTSIFPPQPVYHYYLSVTAIFLNTSWSLHNVIAWIKNKPFLSRNASLFYIITVALVQPYWVIEIVANWLYFGNWNNLFVYTRPYEALFRDPWWIFTCCSLFWNIKQRYEFGYVEIIKVSPRFGVLLVAMMLSICFIILDILAVTHVINGKGLPDGINPFWKLAFVFKCLTDTIVLDDFKTALDRLKQYKLETMGNYLTNGTQNDFVDLGQALRKKSDSRSSPTLHDSTQLQARDWTKAAEGDDIDLESALRLDSIQDSAPVR